MNQGHLQLVPDEVLFGQLGPPRTTTTEELPATEELRAMDNDALAATWMAADAQVRAWRRHINQVDMLLTERLDAADALELPAADYRILAAPKVTYDQTRMTPLKEILPSGVLSEAYVAAHTEHVKVPEKWNMVKAKGWGKRFGAQVQAIIDNARLESPGKIKVTQR